MFYYFLSVTCANLMHLTNADIVPLVPSTFTPGTSVIFSCGFTSLALDGPLVITCLDTGKWSALPPQCGINI